MLTTLLLAFAMNPPKPAITVENRQAAGAQVQIVRIPLKDRTFRVSPIVAKSFPGGDEAATAMVKRTGALAAVNGAYFSRTTLLPIGDVLVDGELIHSGRMGTALILSPDGTARIERVVRHKTMNWEGEETVLACGPQLVQKGLKDVDPAAEGFRDPAIMGSIPRMGIGLTASSELLFVHVRTRVSFEKMAEVFVALGCESALNLDGGASLFLFANGKTLIPAGRKLPVLLGVFRR